jgi:hypothetical protein
VGCRATAALSRDKLTLRMRNCAVQKDTALLPAASKNEQLEIMKTVNEECVDVEAKIKLSSIYKR